MRLQRNTFRAFIAIERKGAQDIRDVTPQRLAERILDRLPEGNRRAVRRLAWLAQDRHSSELAGLGRNGTM
jgi:hypothetical protein